MSSKSVSTVGLAICVIFAWSIPALTTSMIRQSLESPQIGPAAAGTYHGFPDLNPDNGKFLGEAGDGIQTLAGTTNKLYFGIPAGSTSFTVGIFDGEGDNNWDDPSGTPDTLDFKLYTDPYKSGATTPKDSWNSDTLKNDDWSNKTYTTSGDTPAPSGNFFYRIEVNWHDPSTAYDINSFKLRVDGQISVVKSQPFCIEGAPIRTPPDPPLGSADPHPGEQNDPNANSYDGAWDFYFYVPTKVDTMRFQDGDFDRWDDTDDPNTPNVDPDGPGPAIPEGENDGAPPDDPYFPTEFTVSPDVFYTVTNPAGNGYANNNPSGNQEWENFIISDNSSLQPDYLTSGVLQPGLWKIHISGLDAHNLACLSAPYEVFTENVPPLPIYAPPTVVPDNGALIHVPPAQTVSYAHTVTNPGASQVFDLTAQSSHSWTTRIYHDLDGDGVLDPGEPLVTETGTLPQNSSYKIIVQVDVPLLATATTDILTVRASSQLEWAVQGTAKDTTTVITNRPPVPNAGGPYNGYENSPVTLDGSRSSDPDNDPLKFRWDFQNDGLWDTQWSTSPTVTYTWGDDYAGVIALEVSDGNLTAKTTARVIVSNVMPSGMVTVVSSEQHEGTLIEFSAHVTDPGSDDVFFAWSWGDGTPKEYSTYYNDGISPDPYPSPDIHPRDVTDVKTHAFGDNGAYSVTVEVTDDDCVNCSTVLQVGATVDNLPPSVVVSGMMRSIDEGQSLTLSAAATDPGSDDLNFNWSWGEGNHDSATYFNNGASPDPSQSPWGIWPFTATDNVTHPYGDNGLYPITLTLIDDDGGLVTWSEQLVVNNLPPSIQPFGPFSANEGSSFQVSTSVTDPGSDDLTFAWSFELGPTTTHTHYNDGVGPDPFPSPGPTYPFTASDGTTSTYGDNGDYTMTLTVSDDDGGSDTYSTTVAVANLPPSIGPFGPYTVDEGSPLNVSATAVDSGSDDLTFSWAFELGPTLRNAHYNDGANPDPAKSPWGTFPFSAQDIASNTYGDNAVYSLTLTVTDDDGGQASYTTDVTVLNVAPTVAPFGPFTLSEGSPLNVSVTAKDVGSDDLMFKWIFELGPTILHTYYNDGTGPDPAKSPWGTSPFTAADPVMHIYGDNGVYSLVLNVTDDDGGYASQNTTVTVNNLPPVITPFGPYLVDEGHPFNASAIATDAGSDDLIFDWEFELGPDVQNVYYNDGVGPDPYPSPNGTFPFIITDVTSHTYGDNGVYNLTLKVTDDDGGSATYVTQAIVSNLPPSISDFGPYTVDEGSSLNAGTSAEDPGSDDLAFTWTWELGPTMRNMHYNDGVNPDPEKSPWGTFPFTADDSVTHTYGDNGVYSLYLVVKDDDGGVTSYLTNVTVNNVQPAIAPFGPFEVNEGDQLTLRAIASDPGSDDLRFTWSFEYGPTVQHVHYNDGFGPDPPKSPNGTFPFSVEDSATWTYGDNGVFDVSLKVEDDDGGVALFTTTVTVHNLQPVIEDLQAYVLANITLRVAGEKWHDVCMDLVHDNQIEGNACVVRYPGSPDRQSATIKEGRIQLIGDFRIVLRYTPWDDPINGQPNGANPVWVIVVFPDGSEVRLHHTFNVQHPETWNWTISDLRPYLVGQRITFNATATDAGSDDLEFTWSWGDGSVDSVTNHYNDGVGPDPYPSPNGTFPFAATDVTTHAYANKGTYTVTLVVTDDDGGLITRSFDILVG